MESTATYFKAYAAIISNSTLTPIERIVIVEILSYWNLRSYPKYILLGKEKLAKLAGTERHTVKRVLDSLIAKGLITIYNYDDIKDKNRTLPQIAVNERNVNNYFQEMIFTTPGDFKPINVNMKKVKKPEERPETPTSRVNIDYINSINRKLREGNGN